MIVYVDTLIFTNTIVDFILLTATDFIVRRQSSILRSVIASVAGGLSSLYIFLQSDTLIFDLLFKPVTDYDLFCLNQVPIFEKIILFITHQA